MLKKSRFIALDGWMTCYFTSFPTVFQSYGDEWRMIIKECVQWNPVYDRKDFDLERGSNPGRQTIRPALNLMSTRAELSLLPTFNVSVKSMVVWLVVLGLTAL